MSKDSPPQPLPPDVLEKFQSELTPELYNRLVEYAERRCKSLTWYGLLGGTAAKGKSGQDFVHDAISLFLTGVRNWNPENCDLKRFLAEVIRSITGHSATCPENISTVRNTPRTDENGNEQDLSSQVSESPPSYEEIEEVSMRETLLLEFMEFIQDTPEVFEVFELIYEGENKPAKIAEMLGIKVKEVNNLKKRLQTKIDQFKKAHDLPMKK